MTKNANELELKLPLPNYSYANGFESIGKRLSENLEPQSFMTPRNKKIIKPTILDYNIILEISRHPN